MIRESMPDETAVSGGVVPAPEEDEARREAALITNGVSVDEDGFALSEMIQFIWRSAIRDGKEITLYVPSSRMRNLLLDWLEEISK